MAGRLGLKCKLYRNTGPRNVPVWVELRTARDVTLNLEKGEADLSSRGTGGWEAVVFTLKKAGLDLELVYDPEDAGHAALLDSFLNDTLIDTLVLDGPVTTPGSQGLRADMGVGKFSRKEPLVQGVTVDSNLKPIYSSNPTAWYTAT